MILIGKALIAAACWVLTVLVLRSRVVRDGEDNQFTRLAWGLMLVTRLSLFSVLYIVLGYPVPSDVAAAYYPEAKLAMGGGIPYQDIRTTYAPLFPYVAAVPLLVWDSPKAIVLLTICFEAVGFKLWLQVARPLVVPMAFRSCVILYSLSPLLLASVAMGGQNHVWISPFLAAGIAYASRSRDLAAGVLSGIALVATKFLVLVLVPPIYIRSGKRLQFAAGFLAITGLIYATLLVLGADVLYPLTFQRSGGEESSGNLPYLLSIAGIPLQSRAWVLVGGGSCAAAAVFLASRVADEVEPRTLICLFGCVLLFALILLFSKKAFTYYWAALYFPLALTWIWTCRSNRFAVWMFQLWSALASLEPSLYFRWVERRRLDAIMGEFFTSEVGKQCEAGTFMILQLIVVGTGLCVAVAATRSILSLSSRSRNPWPALK